MSNTFYQGYRLTKEETKCVILIFIYVENTKLYCDFYSDNYINIVIVIKVIVIFINFKLKKLISH